MRSLIILERNQLSPGGSMMFSAAETVSLPHRTYDTLNVHTSLEYNFQKTVEEALQIDQQTGTSLWHDAIQKEMKNNAIAFEFLMPGANIPIGYKKISLHMVFDIKMDLTRKARLVAGGHMTEVPHNLTYSSVVSRESVRIMFLIAALNDLQILSADIGNAYLNAPYREKVYATAGKEFGSRAGETVIIVRALYGLKSAGASWRSHLANSLHGLGYRITWTWMLCMIISTVEFKLLQIIGLIIRNYQKLYLVVS